MNRRRDARGWTLAPEQTGLDDAFDQALGDCPDPLGHLRVELKKAHQRRYLYGPRRNALLVARDQRMAAWARRNIGNRGDDHGEDTDGAASAGGGAQALSPTAAAGE